MSTNFSSWPFLSLGQEEWLRRFDGDEVVPVSFQFYDRKSTTPAGPFITQRPDDPRPNGVLTGRASFQSQEGKVRSRDFLRFQNILPKISHEHEFLLLPFSFLRAGGVAPSFRWRGGGSCYFSIL